MSSSGSSGESSNDSYSKQPLLDRCKVALERKLEAASLEYLVPPPVQEGEPPSAIHQQAESPTSSPLEYPATSDESRGKTPIPSPELRRISSGSSHNDDSDRDKTVDPSKFSPENRSSVGGSTSGEERSRPLKRKRVQGKSAAARRKKVQPPSSPPLPLPSLPGVAHGSGVPKKGPSTPIGKPPSSRTPSPVSTSPSPPSRQSPKRHAYSLRGRKRVRSPTKTPTRHPVPSSAHASPAINVVHGDGDEPVAPVVQAGVPKPITPLAVTKKG